MKTYSRLMAVVGVAGLAAVGFAQGGYMADSQAAISMNNDIQGQMTAPGFAGPPPVPGQVPGVANPGGGFSGAPMGGNTMPGNAGAAPGNFGVPPGEMGMMGAEMGGQQGVPAFQAPPPVELAKDPVYVGRRVFDAVSGGLLEDAVGITVRQSDLSAYLDDGINDNGIANDQIYGNVMTSRNQFIGYFSNVVKNYLIHAVHNAEQIDPMVFSGHHIAKIDPAPVDGLKRYGLPLPGEDDPSYVAVVNVEPDFPSILDLERQRDDSVRGWNQRFLAKYRMNPEDPQSEYFPVFVSTPPLTPTNYPVPNGYVSPQSVAMGAQKNLDAATAALAVQQSTTVRGGMGGPGGAADF